jgi:hypothetical protein
MTVACKVCSSAATDFLFESWDRVHAIPGRFQIYRCRRCGALFIEPWLTHEQLAPYYPEHYGRYRVSKSLEKGKRRRLRCFVLENYYGYRYARGDKDAGSKKRRLLSFLL